MNRSRRRILIAAERASPNGGTGSHVAASATALRNAGHDVLLALGEEIADSTASETHVVPGLAEKEAPADTHTRLSELIARLEPDLVHIQQLPDAGFISTIREHAPVVFNVHNHLVCTSGSKYFRKPGSECRRPHGPGCVPNLMLRGCAHTPDPRDLPLKYRRVSRMVAGLRSADVVVAHSRFVLDELRSNGVERTAAVPLFVDPVTEPSPPPDSGPIVFSGRVTEAKGVSTFLRAAARVDAPTEILGDGWSMPSARRLARSLGIEDRLTLRGWLDPAGLMRAYRRARVVVVPSHWPEPFGLVGLEAMVGGRPVVGSATGGIPEWLKHGSNGLLVAPGDVGELAGALSTLLSDPEMAARMGAAGVERARSEFTAERYVDAIEGAYDTAVGRWGAG
jgi:glycosyltransferase involved in cell wall biosynthesis